MDRTAKRPSAAPAPSRWLVTVAQLPTEDPAARMRVLRMLESLGAAVMREGAYALPDTPQNRNALERLAEYVRKGAGSAHVLQVAAASAEQDGMFRALFDRSARYAELAKTIESLQVGFGVSEPGALSRVVHKLRRDFESIASLDFFPNASRARAEQALAGAEEAVRKLLFSAQKNAPVDRAKLQRRTWVTRKPLWADRLACAWLIRRFLDPEGSVTWLDKSEAVAPDAVGFAFAGAPYGYSETRVTFEELLVQFGLAENRALARIGGIVHFLEVRGEPVPEAAGVQTLLQGAVRRSANENELLQEAEKTFDLLYEAYYEAPRPGEPGERA
jgi:hypothetical protein